MLNSLAAGVNLMNGVYERDLGVRFVLVSTAALVFDNPATDPYPISNQDSVLLMNQVTIDALIGTADYDIGHCIAWANVGGLAGPGVCDDEKKAEGFSGNDDSMVTLFIDYVAHEIGHQFDAPHTMAGLECDNSEDGERFEPGEGTSIMAYAGNCPEEISIQAGSDPFFHSSSIEIIQNDILGAANCFTTSTPGAGNAADPVVTLPAALTIPKQTPFVLVGAAADANDPAGQLTYSWEQFDPNSPATMGAIDPASTLAPLFRFRPPTTAASRVFPPLAEVLAGNNNGVAWERLPTVARALNFRLLVRDNNPNWGRTADADMTVTVADTGPFSVLTPNGGETWIAGSPQTVTWSVNGTDAHCASVDVLFSTDGGATYAMAAVVPNNGAAVVTTPAAVSTSARAVVQCSVPGATFATATTFFDASDAAFVVSAALPVVLSEFSVTPVGTSAASVAWTTATERNSDFFEVERASGAQAFAAVARVAARGDSDGKASYEFSDRGLAPGTHYYRLRQVDRDSSFEYSSVVAVAIHGAATSFTLYPNPARGTVSLRGLPPNSVTSIQAMNYLGQTIGALPLSGTEVDISRLPTGVYLLSVSVDDQSVQMHRLVVR